MKIAVCIKRVPDSETRVKIAADGKALDESGVKFVMNPYDEFAVEEALRRKEQAGTGAGEVTVICLGPAAAQETIRTALAMGADRGGLLQADKLPADPLGLPCVTAISHLEIEGTKGFAEREIEGGIEVVEFPLPAVLTADKGLNEPRYPALKGIMAAKKKPLEVKPVQASAGAFEVVALSPPPERKEGKIVGEGVGAVGELVRLLREEAKVL